jgi:hypothetical protein
VAQLYPQALRARFSRLSRHAELHWGYSLLPATTRDVLGYTPDVKIYLALGYTLNVQIYLVLGVYTNVQIYLVLEYTLDVKMYLML